VEPAPFANDQILVDRAGPSELSFGLNARLGVNG